jgi:hypothetical protein
MLQRNDSAGVRRRDAAQAPARLRILSFEARPPCHGPRPRALDADAVAAFGRWLIAELALAPDAQVSVTEWVSLDCREVPHTTFVSVTSGSRQLAFSIGKSMDAIQVDDLPEGVRRKSRAPGAPSGGAERTRDASRKEIRHVRSAR